MNLLELRRQVSNEAHHFREFARFQSLDSKVYDCHLEPKNDVIMLVGNHFSDRMPSEHWMIIDDNRKTSCVHVKDGENYLRYLTDDEFSVLQKTESYEDEYTDMWKTFFHSISIEQRKNYVCQRNLFPIKRPKQHIPVFFHHILFHYTWKFRPTTQVKHGDFPFSTRTVLEQKKRHAAQNKAETNHITVL